MLQKILVVDDEKLILKAVERSLSKVGYRVSGASNMEDLGTALVAAPFDLLITDIHLAEVTVDEVIQRVREGSPSVKIMMMSGSYQKERSLDFIEKPFSIKELRQKVKDILSDDPSMRSDS